MRRIPQLVAGTGKPLSKLTMEPCEDTAQRPPTPAPNPAPTDETVEAPTVEVARQPGEEDELDFNDDPFDFSDDPFDDSTSITSSVRACTDEHDRRYQCFKIGRYPIPNDDQEQDREDMKHAMLMELTDGALFFSPIGDNPQSILDVGTGTGEWRISVLIPVWSRWPLAVHALTRTLNVGIWAIEGSTPEWRPV